MQKTKQTHISAELSLYPMETVNSDQIINASLQALDHQDMSYETGPLSTKISGTPDDVWQGLRHVFEMALQEETEVAMVVTVANSKI